MKRRTLRRTTTSVAVLAAAVAGFLGATVLLVGPRRLSTRAPFAPARALLNGTGGDADAPLDIPARGWWVIAQRTALQVARNRLMAESAAVTFYTLLALFPALTAIVSVYGLFADPAAISSLLDAVADVMPAGGVEILRAQLQALVSNGHRGLSLGAAIGLATALWSANQGSKALFESLNVVYREREKRSYPHFVLVAFSFTLAAIVFVIVAMVGVVALPEILRAIGLSGFAQSMFRWLRWPVILCVVAAFLASLYRFGPSREEPKWRWVSWGGAFAAVSWVAVSFAFSWYVQSFGSFDRTYGSLGAVVGFMVWIWLSTLVVLCGAQLNSEMEHQTGVDTTTGAARPMGLRGAVQADSMA